MSRRMLLVAMQKAFKGSGCYKVPGTGVVHMVPNKIRLNNQTCLLDGKMPNVLIVPIMNLEMAKKWRGEEYNAICLAGFPSGTTSGCIQNDGSLHENIMLTSHTLKKVKHTERCKSKRHPESLCFSEKSSFSFV